VAGHPAPLVSARRRTAPDESVNGRFSAAAMSFTQQPVAQLPWGHVTVLLDKLDDQRKRDWYAAAAVEHGWSRNVLLTRS
jgi:predicted nuclease of restriction endonuclease-like (RecB) superfamily